jgi:hypothetical protein
MFLIALGLWAEVRRQRVAFCLDAAARDEKQAKDYFLMLRTAEQGVTGYDHPGEGDYYRRINQHYERMAFRYRKAAFRPWVALPEEPEMVEGAKNTAPRWRGPWR